MVLPEDVWTAAYGGHIGPIRRWFERIDAGEAQGDANETDDNGKNLLYWCAIGCDSQFGSGRSMDEFIRIVRYLVVSRGADVNLITPGGTALHPACIGVKTKMIRCLLGVGADPSILVGGIVPLLYLIRYGSQGAGVTEDRVLEVTLDLLRAGAEVPAVNELDNLHQRWRSRFSIPRPIPNVRALIESVNLHGSWRQHCRAPHKRLLALRSLVARGRATATAATSTHVDRLLTPRFPSDLVWLVLEYWSPTD